MRLAWALVAVLAGAVSALAQTTDVAALKTAGDIGLVDTFLHDHPADAGALALRDDLAGQARGLVLMPMTARPDYVAQRAALDKAMASGQAVDYQAMLAGFPDGIYAGFAKEALAKLPPPTADDGTDFQGMTFTTPFPKGDQIAGQSIEQLIANASPLFTPIEGIPEEMWKGQHCANCHQWTQPALCDQAKIYVSGAAAIPDNAHPLGPDFRKGLREWAKAGCK